MYSMHVNINENGMDANDGWLSIAGKATCVWWIPIELS